MRFLLLSLLVFVSSPSFAGYSHDPIEALRQMMLQMNAVATNIANAETTRTLEGGAYQKKTIDCDEIGCQLRETPDFRFVYEPSSVDADSDGYVAYPYIDVLAEMEEMIRLQKVYDEYIQEHKAELAAAKKTSLEKQSII